MCGEAASFNISTLELAGAVREIDRCIAGTRNRVADDDEGMDGEGFDGGGGGGGGLCGASANDLLRMKEVVLAVDSAINSVALMATRGEPRYVRHGDGLHTLLAQAGIRPDNVSALTGLCDKCVTQLGEGARFGITGGGGSFQIQKLADALRLAYDAERPPSEYRLCVQELPDRNGGGKGGGRDGGGGGGGRGGGSGGVLGGGGPRARTLGYWCFHSGYCMKQFGQARSVLLTSGTLSPLSSFADELGLPFAHQLENPHVIQPHTQLMVGVLPKGPSGAELTSAYSSRGNDAAKADLGNALVNFCRVVPQVSPFPHMPTSHVQDHMRIASRARRARTPICGGPM